MKRKASPDPELAQKAVHDLLSALGFDPTDPAIVDTPKRVAKAWAEMLSGYDADTHAILKRDFGDVNYDEVIVLRGVPFYSTCEHHLLPFVGSAGVAYIPGNGRVVGLSKLARLVEAHARRLQIQERMTADIAGDLERELNPKGVAVIVRASHSCMCARGVQKPGSEMVTSKLLGAFKDKPEARAEVLALLREGST